MRFYGYWTIFVALIISLVAAYYSIVGLVAIFASAMLPIIIMGSALEIGKLTTVVWLHQYWHIAKFWVKSYLSIAVVILMFITSMGIFGFLSKAHIEQASTGLEQQAQLERVDGEILRIESIITRSEGKINSWENADNTLDDGLQSKIDAEEKRIATAYDRVKPLIDEQNKYLKENLELYNIEIQRIDDDIDVLKEALNIDTKDRNSVRKLQTIIGARPDGRYGNQTAGKVEDYRASLEVKRNDVLVKIQELRDATGKEIARIRSIADKEIVESNKLITRLKDQIGQGSTEDVDVLIDGERIKVKNYNVELDGLFETKYAIEKEARAFEAEVGPVKYIAELIYGEDVNRDLLEDAVRWVIILLVIVFDPLAVMLVIAGITILEITPGRRKQKPQVQETLAVDQEVTPPVKKKQPDSPAKKDSKDDKKDIRKTKNKKHKDVSKEVQKKIDEQIEAEDIQIPEGLTPAEIEDFKRNYFQQQEQLDLNTNMRDKKKEQEKLAKTQIAEVVEIMKKEGRWPNPPTPTERPLLKDIIEADDSGKLEQILEDADDETLQKVYREMIKDIKDENR